VHLLSILLAVTFLLIMDPFASVPVPGRVPETVPPSARADLPAVGGEASRGEAPLPWHIDGALHQDSPSEISEADPPSEDLNERTVPNDPDAVPDDEGTTLLPGPALPVDDTRIPSPVDSTVPHEDIRPVSPVTSDQTPGEMEAAPEADPQTGSGEGERPATMPLPVLDESDLNPAADPLSRAQPGAPPGAHPRAQPGAPPGAHPRGETVPDDAQPASVSTPDRSVSEEPPERQATVMREPAPDTTGALCSREGPFGLKAACYRYPDQLLQTPWHECKQVLEEGRFADLQPVLNRLYQARLDTGFPNAPGYAALLVRAAYRIMGTGDLKTARLLGQSAYDLAPDFYPVSVFMSRLARQDEWKEWRNVLQWQWISTKQRCSLFRWQYSFIGKVFLLFLLTVAAAFLFLAPYFLTRYGKLFLHAMQESMKPGLPGRAQLGALLVFGVTALVLLPGFLWIVVLAGFLTGRYFRFWEKSVFIGFLLFLAVSPFTLHQAARFLSPLPEASQVLSGALQGTWNAARDRDMERALRKYPDSDDLLLTHALVEKRRGNYEQASSILGDALEMFPDHGAMWNNMGNLHGILGDLGAAKDAYGKSIHQDPGVASPHYNLSLLLRREFSFIGGGREFQKARHLDASRVEDFSYVSSQNPNRFFMDENPSLASCWRFAMDRDEVYEQNAEALWSLSGSGIPLAWAPWAFLSSVLAFLLLTWKRRRRQDPLRCGGCGVIICETCQSGTSMTKMCTQCYQALYLRKSVPKEKRTLQIRKMARIRTARTRKLLLLNLTLPGLGFSILRDRVPGFLFLFLFLYLTLAALFWERLMPLPVIAWEPGGAKGLYVFAAFILVLYTAVQVRFLSLLRSGR
jgi:tetratricopeptide (TPR) repeat protein